MQINIELQQSTSSFSDMENEFSHKVLGKTLDCAEISDEKMSEREKKTFELESSIMEWFKGKGVTTGNPSEIL